MSETTFDYGTPEEYAKRLQALTKEELLAEAHRFYQLTHLYRNELLVALDPKAISALRRVNELR